MILQYLSSTDGVGKSNCTEKLNLGLNKINIEGFSQIHWS